MQVNSTVQAPEVLPGGHENTGEIHAENPENASLWQSGNAKKPKQGLFSRLLDSLTGKARKITRETAGQGARNEQIPGEGQIPVSVNLLHGQKPEKPGLLLNTVSAKAEKSSEKAETPAISAVTEQRDDDSEVQSVNDDKALPDAALVETAAAVTAEPQTPLVSAEADRAEQPELSAAAPIIQGENLGISAEVSPPEPPSQEIAAAEIILPAVQTREKAAAGRAAVDAFPARNLEPRAYQFSGEPKFAAVDSIARQDERRESFRPGEARAKKGRERALFEVRDLRTDSGVAENSAEQALSSNSLFLSTEKIDADISVDLNLGAAQDNVEKAFDQSQSSRSVTFENALAGELRENLNSDIVRQASVILRNGGEGLIRLSLKPENLGNVKIRLEMTENKITGHIIVESSEALRAFERELPVLEKAFRDSGFSETNLDMFLAQDNGNYNPNEQRNREVPVILPETAASHYDTEADHSVVESVGSGFAERTTVNMLI